MVNKTKDKRKGLVRNEKGILDNLKVFLQHIGGLEKGMSIFMMLTTSLYRKESEVVSKFIDQKGKDLKHNSGVKIFKLEIQDQYQYEKLLSQEVRTEAAIKLIPRSIFVSLVSQFDIFIANMMRSVLKRYPTAIPKDKTLTFEEMSRFRNIKEIERYFIEDEIDNILRGNHIDLISWFDKKLGLNSKELLKDQLQMFVELTERRNLFVHNDGIVNDQYINNCRKSGVIFAGDVKKGHPLRFTKEYFYSSYKCLYEISAKLAWIVERKINANDIDKIDEFFNNYIGIDLIKNKEYKLAQTIFSFFINNSIGSKDLIKNMFLINVSLAKKLDGDKLGAEGILAKKDWSACKNELQLAVHLIKDEYDDAFSLMEKIGNKSDIVGKDSYESDPIYKDLREKNSERFKKVFKKIFKEEYKDNSFKESQNIESKNS